MIWPDELHQARLQALLAFDSDFPPVKPSILRLRTFWAFLHVEYPPRRNHRFESVETNPDTLFRLKQHRRKHSKALDALRLPFSSPETKRATPPAYGAFPAQNQTFSTTSNFYPREIITNLFTQFDNVIPELGL